MSAQRLSARSVRRIERATGLKIVRAWSHGGYTFPFVVADPEHFERHRHYVYDKKTGDWRQVTSRWAHYSSCRELFGESSHE